MTTLPLAKLSLKFKLKSIGRKPNKVKPTKKGEVTERAIWNHFKESDFLPLNWCTSDEDYFQHLAEEIVRVWIVSLREEIKREISLLKDKDTATRTWRSSLEISLLKDKDTATRAWRSSLDEWLIVREETKKRNEAEAEERRRHDEEIDMYIKRSEELKAKGMSRNSKDGRFLNIKAGGFSRFCIEFPDNSYPKAAR
ncbi:hypothetical protein AgCh_003943 [Apium graveolens]